MMTKATWERYRHMLQPNNRYQKDTVLTPLDAHTTRQAWIDAQAADVRTELDTDCARLGHIPQVGQEIACWWCGRPHPRQEEQA